MKFNAKYYMHHPHTHTSIAHHHFHLCWSGGIPGCRHNHVVSVRT